MFSMTASAAAQPIAAQHAQAAQQDVSALPVAQQVLLTEAATEQSLTHPALQLISPNSA